MRILFSLLLLGTIAFSDVFSNVLLQTEHEVMLADLTTESGSENESELENEVKNDSKLDLKGGLLANLQFHYSKRTFSAYALVCILSPHLEIFSPPPEL